MYKKIIAFMLLSITMISCINAKESEKEISIYENYEVSEKDSKNFYESLEDKLIKDESEYLKKDYTVTGGNVTDTIEVTDTKEIITKTNSLEEILNYLPRTMNYEKDGYTGTTNLDIDNISVSPIYNGYYEVYVEDTKQYFDLPKNDMDYIPKEIEKDGLTLYLINVDWYTQTKKLTGNIEITDLYRGEAHYKGVKKIDFPYTYKVVAGYKGKASKVIEHPYIFKVEYTLIPKKQDDTGIIIGSITSGISGIFVIVILIIRSRYLNLYEFKKGEYKYLGKVKISNSKVNITRKTKNSIIGRYKLVFVNKKEFEKYSKNQIQVIKKDKRIDFLVTDKEIVFTI